MFVPWRLKLKTCLLKNWLQPTKEFFADSMGCLLIFHVVLTSVKIHQSYAPKMFMFLGPLNGFLLVKTSTRFVTGFGVCLMTVSLLAFAYVPSVEYMYLVLGVGFGKKDISNPVKCFRFFCRFKMK